MHTVFVSNLFPSPSSPLRGLFSKYIVASLRRHCDVTVCCPLPWTPPIKAFYNLFPEYDFANVPYHISGGADFNAYYPKYFLIPKLSDALHASFMIPGLYHCLHRIHKSHPIDLLNAHWIYPDGTAAYAVSKLLKIPCVLTALGCDINEMPRHQALRRQIEWALSSSRFITSVSEQLKNNIVDITGKDDNVAVIPNGVDLKQFTLASKEDCRARLNLPKNASIVVYVARLSEEKGPHILAQAIKHIASRGLLRDILFLFIGDGPLKAAVENSLMDEIASGFVRFVGVKTHAELPLWISASDLLCLPSLREGHPNVAMEALACGRPVVASRVGDLPSILNDVTGVLFTPGDPVALSDGLVSSLQKKWRPACIREAVAAHSWDSCASAYFKVYQHCLAGSNI
jgi:teichuronic acid biosynthesis glycosyltransferase TuaC